MSNKQQLQTNNEKYASLIETLRGKAIPSGSEDLDTELTEQENLISQLSTILDSKASGGNNMISVTLSGDNKMYYWDENGMMQYGIGQTVSAYGGLIVSLGTSLQLVGTGDYIFSYADEPSLKSLKFNSDGGEASLVDGGSN